MPTAAPRPCPHPGCGVLVSGGGLCPPHRALRQAQQDARRGSSVERGYGWRWRVYREHFLRRHPLCGECDKAGRTTKANEVDHIKPHRGDQALFWAPDNHQALCKSHHSQKTAREDGGFGRRGGGVESL